MANEKVNKVIYNGNTLLDLTADTITPADLAYGVVAHDRSGEVITGTNTYDANTSDADATAAEILLNKSGYVNGVKVVGAMPNRGGVTGSISDISTPYAIQNGYHDGSGTVGIASVEAAKIIAGNIKDGVSILGVTGTYTGEGVTAQTKNVTPAATAQTVLPDSDYDYLAQVNVAAIPYTETVNSAGGLTATIG